MRKNIKSTGSEKRKQNSYFNGNQTKKLGVLLLRMS